MAVSNQQSRDAALLRATTELFALGTQHDADEIRRFEELATHFLGKVSPADRAFVAERLAKTRDAPASVLRMLAKDLIEIASPILRRSEALSEIDLLSILSATGPAHHRLIAQRPRLSAPVVTALRLAGDPDTIALLSAYPAPETPSRAEPKSIAPEPPAAPKQPAITEAPAPIAAPLPPFAPRDPAGREVFAVARAMTAALSFEMTSLATLRPESIVFPPPAAQAAEPSPETSAAARSASETSEPPVTPDPPAIDVLSSIESPAAVAEEPTAEEPGTLPSAAELRDMDEALQTSTPEPTAGGSPGASVPDIDDFLGLDARGRYEALARVLGRAGPADPGMTVIDADNAFRIALGSARVSQHARRRQREALIGALAGGLRLDIDCVAEIADDPSGEALVILLRAIGLSESEAHQVLLFANPVIAEAVESFFRLARLAGEISREAAENVVSAWRGDPQAHGHQPYLAETEARRGEPRIAAEGNRQVEDRDVRSAG